MSLGVVPFQSLSGFNVPADLSTPFSLWFTLAKEFPIIHLATRPWKLCHLQHLGACLLFPRFDTRNKAGVTIVTYHILTTILLVTSDYIFKILEGWKWCLVVPIAVEKPRQENNACLTCRICGNSDMPVLIVSHQNSCLAKQNSSRSPCTPLHSSLYLECSPLHLCSPQNLAPYHFLWILPVLKAQVSLFLPSQSLSARWNLFLLWSPRRTLSVLLFAHLFIHSIDFYRRTIAPDNSHHLLCSSV